MRATDLDAYQSPWLSVADLQGRARRLTISQWSFENVKSREGETVRKVAVAFEGARKRLLLNTTQAKALDAGLGELERWPGRQVILQPGRTPQGQATIEVVVIQAEHRPPTAPEGESGGDGHAPFQES